ncbi:MAG: hypothetical protein JW864_04800 [Spirochaetes bacterium]|nr:hypothetical protein [Spirochaetota bacterium]
MSQLVVKRQFQSLIITGICATVLCFIATCVYWPIWGTAAKAIAGAMGGHALQLVDAKTAAKYISVIAEASFFWLVINAWIWQTLIFGTYGKTRWTERQPWAGLWYSAVGLISGTIGFLVIVGFLGIWWKPFSLSTLFNPQTVEEIHLAIEGWEASNFYALTVIMVQIPFVSLFQKFPFAGNIKAPWDGFGVFMSATVAALLVWFATRIPSFMKLSIGEHIIVSQPMGSWATFVAWCQGFIFFLLIPAEGGELYPIKLFAKKQPLMGLSGLVLAFVFGFLARAVLRPFVAAFDLLPGMPVDLAVASLILSCIVAMLMWHHLFDDFPKADMVPNQAARVLIRIAIWIVLGMFLGIIWLKTFKMLPFGGNTEFGWPVMGILAGQFAFLMAVLYFNAFFDKWPLVRKIKA